jgi:antitoxin YefM
MPETTLSQFRAKLTSYCEQAVKKRRPIRVKRRQGGDVVLLSAEEYDSLSETAYLLSSPRNAARLLQALASARAGTTPAMTLEELRASVGL